MPPRPRAKALLLLLLAAPALAWAKSSDRNQPMEIESATQDGNFDDNGTQVWTGNVVLTQGTLKINADRGEVQRRNGDPSLAIFTGKPVKMRQQNDDGTWMDAVANRIEYDLTGDNVTLIGDYTIKSPKGSNSGQRMVYNTRSGTMQAGGDGTRVKTVIMPKSAQGQATVGKPTPANDAAPAPSDSTPPEQR